MDNDKYPMVRLESTLWTIHVHARTGVLPMPPPVYLVMARGDPPLLGHPSQHTSDIRASQQWTSSTPKLAARGICGLGTVGEETGSQEVNSQKYDHTDF